MRSLFVKVLIGTIIFILTLGALPSEAQTTPTYIGIGSLLRAGGTASLGITFGTHMNIVKVPSKVAEGKIIGQIYTRIGGLIADDAVVTEDGLKELESVVGYAIGERFFDKFSVATGIGVQIEAREGENAIRAPLLLEGGWRPLEALKVSVGIQYIPVIGSGDWSYLYCGLGFDW